MWFEIAIGYFIGCVLYATFTWVVIRIERWHWNRKAGSIHQAALAGMKQAAANAQAAMQQTRRPD